jgi:hypothetical protein
MSERCDRCQREVDFIYHGVGGWEVFFDDDGEMEVVCPGCLVPAVVIDNDPPAP